jgi:hypothetical protein
MATASLAGCSAPETESGLDHAGMGRQLAGEDAGVDVGAILAQPAKGGGAGCASRARSVDNIISVINGFRSMRRPLVCAIGGIIPLRGACCSYSRPFGRTGIGHNLARMHDRRPMARN